MTKHNIYILDYPGALKSAVFGMQEIMSVVNHLVGDSNFSKTKVLDSTSPFPRKLCNKDYIVIPPAIDDSFYLAPDDKCIKWIEQSFNKETNICASCAGVFILARTNILSTQEVTTHWGLAESFENNFPKIKLNTQYIVKDEGNIITAGGMMSWQDLIFHIIKKLTNKKILNELGRYFVIDIPDREQNRYSKFAPNKSHKNLNILKVQDFIENNYNKGIKVTDLIPISNLGSRTFLREFKRLTHFTPQKYLQKIRILKAQELLETTNHSTSEISYLVGYNDFSAFYRVFTDLTGISPSKFRKKWSVL